MNELFKVNYDSDRITLSARELHGFLEIGTQYTKWFERMSEYGFDEKAFSNMLCNRQEIKSENLPVIAKALNVTVDDLFKSD